MAAQGRGPAAHSRRVVFTGAAGALGTVVRSHLTSSGAYELVLLDREPRDDPEIHPAELSRWDPDWVALLHGAHAVVHLAAEPSPAAEWPSLERDNIDACLNVFEAAAKGGARRVVFASSNHVMEGYYDSDAPITHDLSPRPRTGYGLSKAVGERIGRFYARRYGLSVVCLRIGAVRAEPFPAHADVRLQERWLSHRDLCQAVERAIDVDGIGFAVLNVMSDNAGSPWDLTETRRVLGYVPVDGCAPRRAPAWRRLGRHLRPGR